MSEVTNCYLLLCDAKDKLPAHYRDLFKKYVFDSDRERMCGDHGFVLQWLWHINQIQDIKESQRPCPLVFTTAWCEGVEPQLGTVVLTKRKGFSKWWRVVNGPPQPDGSRKLVVVHPVKFYGRRYNADGIFYWIKTDTLHDPCREHDAVWLELADKWTIHHGLEEDPKLSDSNRLSPFDT